MAVLLPVLCLTTHPFSLLLPCVQGGKSIWDTQGRGSNAFKQDLRKYLCRQLKEVTAKLAAAEQAASQAADNAKAASQELEERSNSFESGTLRLAPCPFVPVVRENANAMRPVLRSLSVHDRHLRVARGAATPAPTRRRT